MSTPAERRSRAAKLLVKWEEALLGELERRDDIIENSIRAVPTLDAAAQNAVIVTALQGMLA
jgi:hypothetical protein